MDHAAAVAAAAFAINLLDVSEGKKETPKALLEKTKNRVDGTKPQIPLLSSASKRLSGKEIHLWIISTLLKGSHVP